LQIASKLHAILDRFREDRPAWRQVDLARALGVPPSTLSRTLTSLVDVGFLRFDADTATYRLGPAIIALAGAAINEYDEFRLAYADMHELMSQTHLGVNLGILRDGRVMYLHHIDGPHMKRGNTLIGRHIPLHATALGKALLLGLPKAEADALIGPDPLRAFTAHTITDPDALSRQLALARTRGYATEREELALGRGCVATPIYGRDGRAAAALSLSGPKDVIRLDQNEAVYAGLLLDATDRISSRLGHRRTTTVT
jgi:DNA-binding IclR family transcriptional regulator